VLRIASPLSDLSATEEVASGDAFRPSPHGDPALKRLQRPHGESHESTSVPAEATAAETGTASMLLRSHPGTCLTLA
jgi:hypothetical protein